MNYNVRGDKPKKEEGVGGGRVKERGFEGYMEKNKTC
jgi:hypothetical protein